LLREFFLIFAEKEIVPIKRWAGIDAKRGDKAHS
jgi:hypothetical protein